MVVIELANGLMRVNRLRETRAYAVVWIGNNSNVKIHGQKRIELDTTNGSNPIWNHSFRFNNISITNAEENGHALVIKVGSKRTLKDK